MRCPDCNKFVSYDEPYVEVQNVDVDDGTVHASCRVSLNCAECGTELKDADIESESAFEHICKPKAELDKNWKPDPDFKEGEDDQYEVEAEGTGEGTNRLEDKDRNGKPIKSARYMKTFYGFTLSTDIRCRKCGEVFTVDSEGEEQASGFNECC